MYSNSVLLNWSLLVLLFSGTDLVKVQHVLGAVGHESKDDQYLPETGVYWGPESADQLRRFESGALPRSLDSGSNEKGESIRTSEKTGSEYIKPSVVALQLLGDDDDSPASDLYPLAKRVPTFRLGKRGEDEEKRAPTFRLGKREHFDAEGKRAPTFRLGKRDEYKRGPTFRLGEDEDEEKEEEKRAPTFRLGKRDEDYRQESAFRLGEGPEEKRAPTFRLGKRAPTFRLGKRAPTFRLGKKESPGNLGKWDSKSSSDMELDSRYLFN